MNNETIARIQEQINEVVESSDKFRNSYEQVMASSGSPTSMEDVKAVIEQAKTYNRAMHDYMSAIVLADMPFSRPAHQALKQKIALKGKSEELEQRLGKKIGEEQAFDAMMDNGPVFVTEHYIPEQTDLESLAQELDRTNAQLGDAGQKHDSLFNICMYIKEKLKGNKDEMHTMHAQALIKIFKDLSNTQDFLVETYKENKPEYDATLREFARDYGKLSPVMDGILKMSEDPKNIDLFNQITQKYWIDLKSTPDEEGLDVLDEIKDDLGMVTEYHEQRQEEFRELHYAFIENYIDHYTDDRAAEWNEHAEALIEVGTLVESEMAGAADLLYSQVDYLTTEHREDLRKQKENLSGMKKAVQGIKDLIEKAKDRYMDIDPKSDISN
ncbi:hypothetical protein ACFL96_04235 [Thermoproteota archaeon]